ncbi:MAG: hypothetical protein A2277_08225 [Desulfobacterales bacterium RIFOXYA12_FULL_46_15]|nr:MAG: hypothetical protein A2277_08225 [Desulfobacterales bacterium RIFOXYA12_FULL_46_15]
MIDPKKHDGKGFTLVEILIAILIFSLVMSVLFSSFRAFMLSSEAVKESVTRNELIRTAFNRIRLDLEAIYIQQPPRYKKPEFNSEPDPYRFVGKEDGFFFSSFAHAGFRRGEEKAISRISYFLKENLDHTFDLTRSDILPPFREDRPPCATPLLFREITGFEAGFVDNKGESHKYWDSETEEFNYSFPAGIHLKINFGSGGKKQVIEASIKIPVERRPFE